MISIRSMPVLALVCAGTVAAQAKQEKTPAPVVPKSAIAAALHKARSHNKRALVVLTDVSDSSELLARAMKTAPLDRLLRYEFAVATVDAAAVAADAKGDEAVNSAAKAPPALVVLDADGKTLAKWTAPDLVTDGKLDTPALADKLRKLAAQPLDGKVVLATALAEAKKSNRRVFVRFDAPW